METHHLPQFFLPTMLFLKFFFAMKLYSTASFDDTSLFSLSNLGMNTFNILLHFLVKNNFIVSIPVLSKFTKDPDKNNINSKISFSHYVF